MEEALSGVGLGSGKTAWFQTVLYRAHAFPPASGCPPLPCPSSVFLLCSAALTSAWSPLVFTPAPVVLGMQDSRRLPLGEIALTSWSIMPRANTEFHGGCL
jgi:hypothetical protein